MYSVVFLFYKEKIKRLLAKFGNISKNLEVTMV
jgi:hypothetical protein